MSSRLINAAVTAALALAVAGSATACSSGSKSTALGMQSLCRDYLGKPQDVQDAAVQLIAGAQHNGGALTPLGRPNVDYFCGNNPDMKLADAVARAGNKSIAPTTSAAPSTAACTGACFTDPTQVHAVLDAAAQALPAMLDRDYRKLDAEHAAALAVIAPSSFRTEFDNTWQSLQPVVVQQKAVLTWRMHNEGIVSLSGSAARVLLYGQNEATNSTTPTPRIDVETVVTSLQRSNGTWLVSDLKQVGSSTGAVAATDATGLGNADLRKSVEAAEREATALSTYSRAHFDADYQRAVTGATGSLRSDLDSPDRRKQLLDGMNSGKFDLKGTVTAIAVESVSATAVKVLATVDGSRVPDGGGDATVTTSRFELTVLFTGGQWLASQLNAVGIS